MTTKPDEKTTSLVEQVLTLARRRILSGEYAPGSHLRIHMLANDSGASLIPAREALRILEAERLVEFFPNRGAHVRPISIDDMRSLYEARILIETEAVRKAETLSAEDVEDLTELLEQMHQAAEAENIDTMMLLHRQYHFAIYNRTTSNWLPYIIGILWNHAERYQRLALAFRHDHADKEHRMVLDALAEGDTDRAAEALESHLRTTAKLVMEAYA
jgi:DNA-binding GntR family transcriptional regulator